MTALDPGRVARSLNLHVELVGDGVYLVTGGREPHTVDCPAAGTFRCDCADARYHPGPCKHRTAVYFVRQLAPAVRDALASAVGTA